MWDFHNFLNRNLGTRRPGDIECVLGGPEDVVAHPSLSADEKRALLASWASDAHAVPGQPSMRQIDDGSIVTIDEILGALKTLDADCARARDQAKPATLWRTPFERRLGRTSRTLSRMVRRRRSDDDDDPPPCPARAAAPLNRGGGGAVFAYPEPALA